MNLNILKPSQAIDAAFEKPNLAIALVLVLLPSLAYLAGQMLYGFDILGYTIYEIVLAYVTFFILALVIYAIGLVFNGEKAKGQFKQVLSAVSLLQLVSLAFIVLSFIAMRLVFSQKLIEFAAKATNPNQISGFIAASPGSVNYVFFAISTVIAIALTVLGICLLYKCIRKITETRAFTSIVLAIIILFILGILPI